MKVIIVGGVAGGASCAARLRRLDEKTEILMVERGPLYPMQTADCLTMWAAQSKKNQSSRSTEQMFRVIFNVDCRTNCEVVGINSKGENC